VTTTLESAIQIPEDVVRRTKKVFDLSDTEVQGFLTALIHTAIEKKIEEVNTQVFTKDEAKQFEDELSGLGYI
jgi:hypothetical protein